MLLAAGAILLYREMNKPLADPTRQSARNQIRAGPVVKWRDSVMTRFHSLSRKLLLTSLPLIPAALILMIALESRPVYAAPAPQAALRMSCSSDDMHRHVCLVDTTGGVQMVHQKSQAKCIQNSTWGYDNRGIWVDRGCRAEFEV